MVLQPMQLIWIAATCLWKLRTRPVLAKDAGGTLLYCMHSLTHQAGKRFQLLQAVNWTLNHFWNSTATLSKQIMPLR